MIYLQKLIQGKFFWPFALGLHLVVLGLLYFKFGISFTNESEKYINAARELNFENFNTTLEYLWPYSTYILFLAVGMKLGISLYVMLFIQYVFCLCGFYFFYKFILSQSFFSKTYARICLLIILTCPLIIYWQLTFYTESFFVSLIMISTYFAFNASSKRNFILAGLFFILLLFCRPAGVFYVISLIFVILKLHRSKFAPAFLFTALAVVFIAIIFFIPLRNNDFALPIYQGSVICGFPAYPQSVLPNENYTLAEVYSEFVKQHDAFTLASLFFKKTLSFFTLTRQYYSFNHNLINSLYYIFFPGAFFSIWNFLKRKEKNLMVTYFISILTTNCIIVGLTYNEWSERFFVPLLPFFILSTMLAIGKTRHYQEI